MTNPTDIPPRDIPDDLVVFALIGGPATAPWYAKGYMVALVAWISRGTLPLRRAA